MLRTRGAQLLQTHHCGPNPANSNTIFDGPQSVWRTQDWGGNQTFLETNCPQFFTACTRPGCGDFVHSDRRCHRSDREPEPTPDFRGTTVLLATSRRSAGAKRHRDALGGDDCRSCLYLRERQQQLLLRGQCHVYAARLAAIRNG